MLENDRCLHLKAAPFREKPSSPESCVQSRCKLRSFSVNRSLTIKWRAIRAARNLSSAQSERRAIRVPRDPGATRPWRRAIRSARAPRARPACYRLHQAQPLGQEQSLRTPSGPVCRVSREAEDPAGLLLRTPLPAANRTQATLCCRHWDPLLVTVWTRGSQPRESCSHL